MALQSTDLLIVERAGVQYQMTADQIADFVGAVRDFSAADITARDALVGVTQGDRVFVTDASSEADVDSGWAIYRFNGATYDKVQEQESMDLVITASTDLSYTASAASGTVVNSAGTDAIIPLVDGTNAGLASPAMFNNSHSAAAAGLTAAANPVNVDGPTQVVTFGITQLTPLP